MIELCYEPIDTQPLVARAGTPSSGAIVVFLGITREFTAGRQTVELHYEAYVEMARLELQRLEAEARKRWPVAECILVHRLGSIPPAEASVAVVISSAHRRDAFAAASWLIDTLKERVPIWKREKWADGTSEWVHPGLQPYLIAGGSADVPTARNRTDE